MLFIIVVTVHILSCILLITVILLQSGKDAGLSGAFGLGGGSQTIFGARAGDILSKATIVLAIAFMTTCILFTRIRPGGGGSIVSKVMDEAKPAESAPAPPAPTGAGAEQRTAE